MAELRWNPLLGTWTMVASNRQARPHLPKDWCPFCPGSGKVPEEYEVYAYDNDFPALTQTPAPPDEIAGGPYECRENYGKCEVILYSPQHDSSLAALPVSHIEKLVALLAERQIELSKDEKIKYIFPFENRGEEVGVTMPHPHGQIYAYPFVPQKIEIELKNCLEYYEANDSCLLCDMNSEEKKFAQRIIAENESFLAYLPFFTDYPYGVFISSKQHLGSIDQFDAMQRKDLALMLKTVTAGFEKLFSRPFPYMMCLHQTPVNCEEYDEAAEYYHFHIEFYPPLREAKKIKFYASSEMGAWAACNPHAVEETAKALRSACEAVQKGLEEED